MNTPEAGLSLVRGASPRGPGLLLDTQICQPNLQDNTSSTRGNSRGPGQDTKTTILRTGQYTTGTIEHTWATMMRMLMYTTTQPSQTQTSSWRLQTWEAFASSLRRSVSATLIVGGASLASSDIRPPCWRKRFVQHFTLSNLCHPGLIRAR